MWVWKTNKKSDIFCEVCISSMQLTSPLVHFERTIMLVTYMSGWIISAYKPQFSALDLKKKKKKFNKKKKKHVYNCMPKQTLKKTA